MVEKDEYNPGTHEPIPVEKIDLLILELEKTPPNTSVCQELQEMKLKLDPNDERFKRASEALKNCS